jgi:hypothetical protein
MSSASIMLLLLLPSPPPNTCKYAAARFFSCLTVAALSEDNTAAKGGRQVGCRRQLPLLPLWDVLQLDTQAGFRK